MEIRSFSRNLILAFLTSSSLARGTRWQYKTYGSRRYTKTRQGRLPSSLWNSPWMCVLGQLDFQTFHALPHAPAFLGSCHSPDSVSSQPPGPAKSRDSQPGLNQTWKEGMSKAENCFLWERAASYWGPKSGSVTRRESSSCLEGRHVWYWMKHYPLTMLSQAEYEFLSLLHISNFQIYNPSSYLQILWKNLELFIPRTGNIFPWLHFNFRERKPEVMYAHQIEILGLLIKPDKASHPGKHSHWFLRNSFVFSKRCNSYFFISFLNQVTILQRIIFAQIYFLSRVPKSLVARSMELCPWVADSVLPPAAGEQQVFALFPRPQPLPNAPPSKTPPLK